MSSNRTIRVRHLVSGSQEGEDGNDLILRRNRWEIDSPVLSSALLQQDVRDAFNSPVLSSALLRQDGRDAFKSDVSSSSQDRHPYPAFDCSTSVFQNKHQKQQSWQSQCAQDSMSMRSDITPESQRNSTPAWLDDSVDDAAVYRSLSYKSWLLSKAFEEEDEKWCSLKEQYLNLSSQALEERRRVEEQYALKAQYLSLSSQACETNDVSTSNVEASQFENLSSRTCSSSTSTQLGTSSTSVREPAPEPPPTPASTQAYNPDALARDSEPRKELGSEARKELETINEDLQSLEEVLRLDLEQLDEEMLKGSGALSSTGSTSHQVLSEHLRTLSKGLNKILASQLQKASTEQEVQPELQLPSCSHAQPVRQLHTIHRPAIQGGMSVPETLTAKEMNESPMAKILGSLESQLHTIHRPAIQGGMSVPETPTAKEMNESPMAQIGNPYGDEWQPHGDFSETSVAEASVAHVPVLNIRTVTDVPYAKHLCQVSELPKQETTSGHALSTLSSPAIRLQSPCLPPRSTLYEQLWSEMTSQLPAQSNCAHRGRSSSSQSNDVPSRSRSTSAGRRQHAFPLLVNTPPRHAVNSPRKAQSFLPDWYVASSLSM